MTRLPFWCAFWYTKCCVYALSSYPMKYSCIWKRLRIKWLWDLKLWGGYRCFQKKGLSYEYWHTIRRFSLKARLYRIVGLTRKLSFWYILCYLNLFLKFENMIWRRLPGRIVLQFYPLLPSRVLSIFCSFCYAAWNRHVRSISLG